MIFSCPEHKKFYYERISEYITDPYNKAFFYTIGACDTTREYWKELRNEEGLNLEALNEPWQTGSSKKVTRFAFNLYNDGVPTCYSKDMPDDYEAKFNEALDYLPSQLFCCSYAPYFVEALKLRYAEYFNVIDNVFTY